MTLQTQVFVVNITEAKIAPVTLNTTSGYTTGEYIELPGLSTVKLTAKTSIKTATENEIPIDSFTLKQGFDVSFDLGLLTMDAIALINGATLNQSGSSPNQVNSFTEASSDNPPLCNLHLVGTISGQSGDVHIETYCVKGLADIGPQSGDYWKCSYSGSAFARLLDGEFRKITQNETAVAIPSNPTAGSLSLVTNIAKTDVGGTIAAVLSGTTFKDKASAETVANYTISAGATGLTVSKVTYLDAKTVILACSGTAAAGTLSVVAKAAATTNGQNSAAGTFVMT